MQVRRAISRLRECGFPSLSSITPLRTMLTGVTPTNQTVVSSLPSSSLSSSTSLNATNKNVRFHSHAEAPPQLGSVPIQYSPPKKIRKTAKQTQIERVNKKKRESLNTAAHKRCTLWYNIEKEKQDGLSATAVCDRVNNVEFKGATSVQARTVTRYVAEGRAGESPKKRGYTGVVQPNVFKLICEAFETYIQINQINSRDWQHKRKYLAALLNKVVGISSDGSRVKDSFLNRVLRATETNFQADVDKPVEEHRLRWTTYDNIKRWFETWEAVLLELGFAHEDDNGNTVIPPNQLDRIFNMDESAISFDGSESVAGGRPSVTIYDPNLPRSGKPATKSAVKVTFIGGSNAAKEPLPAHYQFPTAATQEENEKLRLETAKYMMKTRGRFGHDEEKEFPATIDMNEKGGMDTVELKKLFENSYAPLWPDMEDKPGKRVMCKCDSGPG